MSAILNAIYHFFGYESAQQSKTVWTEENSRLFKDVCRAFVDAVNERTQKHSPRQGYEPEDHDESVDYTVQLSDRMLAYEDRVRLDSDKNDFVVVRLIVARNPLSHSQSVEGLIPEVAKDLFDQFAPGLAHSFGSEIVLVFYPNGKSSHRFNGEVLKMASLAASHATLSAAKHSPLAPLLFTATSFSVPNEDMENYIIWRLLENKKNSILQYAKTHLSLPKGGSLQGKSSDTLVTLLRKQGHEWEDLPVHARYGTFVKRRITSIPKKNKEGVIDGQFVIKPKPYTTHVYENYESTGFDYPAIKRLVRVTVDKQVPVL